MQHEQSESEKERISHAILDGLIENITSIPDFYRSCAVVAEDARSALRTLISGGPQLFVQDGRRAEALRRKALDCLSALRIVYERKLSETIAPEQTIAQGRAETPQTLPDPRLAGHASWKREVDRLVEAESALRKGEIDLTLGLLRPIADSCIAMAERSAIMMFGSQAARAGIHALNEDKPDDRWYVESPIDPPASDWGREADQARGAGTDSAKATAGAAGIAGFLPADWFLHEHGIPQSRLSEAARDGRVSTRSAPKGILDSRVRKVQKLYNEKEALRHCAPKRVTKTTRRKPGLPDS